MMVMELYKILNGMILKIGSVITRLTLKCLRHFYTTLNVVKFASGIFCITVNIMNRLKGKKKLPTFFSEN